MTFLASFLELACDQVEVLAAATSCLPPPPPPLSLPFLSTVHCWTGLAMVQGLQSKVSI